jgi:hypothetical protein
MRLRPSNEKEEAHKVLRQIEGLKTKLKENDTYVPK